MRQTANVPEAITKQTFDPDSLTPGWMCLSLEISNGDMMRCLWEIGTRKWIPNPSAKMWQECCTVIDDDGVMRIEWERMEDQVLKWTYNLAKNLDERHSEFERVLCWCRTNQIRTTLNVQSGKKKLGVEMKTNSSYNDFLKCLRQ